MAISKAEFERAVTDFFYDGWEFIENPDERDQCDYLYPLPVAKKKYEWEPEPTPYYPPGTPRRRCQSEGKYRKGDEYRCGRHTPGVGRKGVRRVPRDPKVSLLA